jgi:phenylalanyl-tRNA synthetase alpha chain
MKELEQIVAAAGRAVADSASVAELELAKARVLGKAGSLTELLRGLGRLPA